MLEQLRFVQGAVAKKEFIPSLTHFCIENGTIRGYNGTFALCSPIPFDISCNPKAVPMVQAIRNCIQTVSLSLTPAGRLSIKSGSFKAFIDCTPESGQHVQPVGEMVEIQGDVFLAGMKALEEFVGEDAARPWACGILVRGPSLYATNNIIIAEYWTGVNFPAMVNIPRQAVQEIIRINEAPVSAQIAEGSFTLHYSGNRWIRTQLLETNWPIEQICKLLDQPSKPEPVNAKLFEALKTVKDFTDRIGRITFSEGMVCTSVVEGEGAKVEVDGLPEKGSFGIEMLSKLAGVAQRIDFTTYPAPCAFFGERMRGAIIGMRPLRDEQAT